MNDMIKKHEFELENKKGIDDLMSEYAFYGNSQGDESVSNSIKDYEDSKGWMSYQFDVPLTQEDINKEVERRKDWNKNYIEELKQKGEYGSKCTFTFYFTRCPDFDV